jgi:hypothetical protein
LLDDRDKIDLENSIASGVAHRLDFIRGQSRGSTIETKTMGKVVVTAIIDNLEDILDVARGRRGGSALDRNSRSRR